MVWQGQAEKVGGGSLEVTLAAEGRIEATVWAKDAESLS